MPIVDTYVTTDKQLVHHDRRQPAFHKVGTAMPEGTSIADGLALAGLDNWNVRTEPLKVMLADGSTYKMPRHQVILRDVAGHPAPIAPIGKQYKPVQNEELGLFAQTLLDESDLTLDSAGSLDGGRRVFLVLRSPVDLTFGGIDKVAPFLIVATGHDGGYATSVKPLYQRLFCTNQISAVIFGRKRRPVEFRLRHTSTLEGRIADARAALGLRFATQDALDAEIERLMATTVTDAVWEQVVHALAPIEEGMPTATVTRRENVRDDLWNLWRAETQEPIKGTAWAGVNAVGEFFDWMGAGASDEAKRARAQMLGNREPMKAAATVKALAVMGASPDA